MKNEKLNLLNALIRVKILEIKVFKVNATQQIL